MIWSGYRAVRCLLGCTHCFFRQVIGHTLLALKLWITDRKPSIHFCKKDKEFAKWSRARTHTHTHIKYSVRQGFETHSCCPNPRVNLGCLQSARWNKQGGTCSLLKKMWAGILMWPSATSGHRNTNNESPRAAATRHRSYVVQKSERWGPDQSVLPLKVKEYLSMCCVLWGGVMLTQCSECLFRWLRLFVGRSLSARGRVLSALKTSFENTVTTKTATVLIALTPTLWLYTTEGLPAQINSSISMGFWFGTATEFPYMFYLTID